MMVFRQKAGHRFKLRVVDHQGRAATLSTGTDDLATAEAIGAMVKRFQRQITRREVLELLVDKRIALADVFYHEEHGTLAEFLTEAKSPDLVPYVEQWIAGGANAKYAKQVRRMLAEGTRFPAYRFDTDTITAFLASLPVSGSTRNRYRAALSVFARWLVKRKVLKTNAVRDVDGFTPNPSRMEWLTPDQARRLVLALPLPYRALEALMAGTGLEWSAVAALRREDVDFQTRTIRARGSKTAWRRRSVRVTEDWAWTIFAEYARAVLPHAPLFSGIREEKALKVHHEESRALSLPKTTLHDWRHTYAVNALQRGMRPQVVKRQLGHAPNSTLLERVYGVWIVSDEDYRVPAQEAQQ